MKMHSSFYIKSCPFMKDFCKAIFYFWGFTLNYKAEVDWAKFESKNTLKALEIFEHDNVRIKHEDMVFSRNNFWDFQ